MADLFAGTGGIAKAARTQFWPAREWDILHGPEGDLTNKVVLRHLIKDIKQGKVLAAVLGPPCASFSRALERSGRFRDDHGIMLPNLTKKNEAKCLVGDLCMAASMKLCMALQKANVPWSWSTRPLRGCGNVPSSSSWPSCPGSRCSSPTSANGGAKWRKTTKLLSGHLDSFGRDRLSQRCSCSGGCCSRSGRPHIQLSGKSPSGPPWTAIAEHYPRELCHEIVAVTMGTTIAQYASKIDSFSSSTHPPSL